MKTALITGITGQDGAWLARYLLDLQYEVHGLVRRASSPNIHRLSRICGDELNSGQLRLNYGDLIDAGSLNRVIGHVAPDELYNLAAQSHVLVSFETPEYTANADGVGALRLLEAIRQNGLASKTRFYQASTSELYGKVVETPQSERTPFYPRSPYGVAKLYGYWITVNYREAYRMHASNGILFNHEGELRGEIFVTRKISKAAARWALGERSILFLGNLDAKRDWGDARDYVRGMHLIVQQAEPDDYVLATGEAHSVREFVDLAFDAIGVKIEWSGSATDEIGRDALSGEIVVKIDPSLFRPTEVDLLLGDPRKALDRLGWRHERQFPELVKDMVVADIARQKLIKANNLNLEVFI